MFFSLWQACIFPSQDSLLPIYCVNTSVPYFLYLWVRNNNGNGILKYLNFCFYNREESEKVGLKLNIQKTKIKASGPITSWEIDGETVETVSDFIFLGSKITADGDCSHEIKRRLLLGRKVMICEAEILSNISRWINR